jgi:iron complex outermembrane receptor protein
MNSFPNKIDPPDPDLRTSKARALAVALLCPILITSLTLGRATESIPGKNLGDLSLEELMNETVTSVSKREQKLSDAAAAITVLSNDDLRRSGATSLPDALRLVPGMDVGAVNAHEWSVSARGFDGLYSNKLLVLVDGRAIYSPFFSGVFWDLQQLMLDDIERIEVIRGPGATVWGANAVNGVINVVSRSARDTQGGLLYAETGTRTDAAAGVRYGGQLGPKTYFRVFGSYQAHDDYLLANGSSAHDGWEGHHGGFRVDHFPDADTTLTGQVGVTRADFAEGASHGDNVNTLGRWTRRWSDRSTVEVQAYYDRTTRDDALLARAVADTIDLTVQQTFGLGSRHDLIAGFGYRSTDSRASPTNALIAVRNAHVSEQLFSAFAQDEFKLVPDRLTLTAGAKIEHNEVTGFEFQPSVRAVWKPAPLQTVWAAVSRAVRTPDEIEGRDVLAITAGAPFQGPDGGLYFPTITGNAHPTSEVLWAYELGYRVQPSRRVSMDLALFYNDYRDLITAGGVARFIPGAPFGIAETPFVNLSHARAYGGEVHVTIAATEAWRLIVGYSRTNLRLSGPPTVRLDPALVPPRQQVSLRSAYDFTRRAHFDVQLRYVDEVASVPAYFTADLRLAFLFTERVEFSLTAQNLLDPQHPEQADSPGFSVASEIPRRVKAKLTWRF